MMYRDALRRAAQRIWEHRLRSRGVTFGHGLRLFGRPIVSLAANSVLSVGPGATIVSATSSQVIGVSHPAVLRTVSPGARIIIGENFGMSGGSVVAATLIQIGDGCLLGADVTIVDTDFHPISSVARSHARMPSPEPSDRVVLGDNVFLGTRTIVLKGSTIGDNSVIGAGSVVTGIIPPNVIAAGVPARVIRELSEIG